MSKFLFSLILLSAVYERTWSYTKLTGEHGSAKVSESCSRDTDCIENAFCRGQQFCMCDTSYAPSADKSVCTATNGLTCFDDTACKTMANATCRQGACACRENFTVDINNSSNCVGLPQKIGDRCQRTDECVDIFDRAMCIQNKCTCLTGHKFVNGTGKCIQTRGIYQRCTENDQCWLDDDTPDALECKKNECVCKDGDSRCSKGSLPVTAGIILALSILAARVI